MSQNDETQHLSQHVSALAQQQQQQQQPVPMQSLHQPVRQPINVQPSQLMLSNHLSQPRSKGSHQQRNCKTEGHTVSATVCTNCGTTTTPLWRRAPNGETICNACGLYYKARNTVRPPWLKRNAIKKAAPAATDNSDNGTCPGDGHCDGTGGSSSCNGCPAFNQHQVNRQALVCANCGTNTTPLWRRDEAGNTICNACGLYFKLHNVHRPVTMKRSVIKRRKRVALATSPPAHHHHHHHHHHRNDDGSEHQQQRGKNRMQHPPTPSASGSDQEYQSSEDDTGSNDGSVMSASGSRKRKNEDEPIGNKRHCRGMPAIEDYIRPKCNTHGHWHTSASQHDGERHTSLSPVEPALPQVEIHQYRGHSMGTPTVPLTSVFSSSNAGQYSDGAASPSHSGSAPSTPPPISSIPPLLNAAQPNSTRTTQLPPLSSVGVSAHTGQNHSFTGAMALPAHHQSQAHSGADGRSDNNIASVLQAHRQELQREVSHLTMLLNRTNAILSHVDQAMASVQNGSGNTEGGSPHGV